MRPYKRTHKPIRYCENYLVGRWFGRTCKAIGSLCKDIQSIWFREPPFPASVRILFSVLLIWILLLPLLYFLVIHFAIVCLQIKREWFFLQIPPLMTIASIYILKCEEIPIFAELPPLPVAQKQLIVKAVKELFKKATFKVSMLVTLYDYVQTFRALGGFNTLNFHTW